MAKSGQNIESALEFVESVEIPHAAALERLEGEPLDILPPGFGVPKDQAIIVGSQIAGYSAGVDTAIRPHISNSFLLAQLAANRHIADHGGTSKVWYDHYIEVLKNIGWVLEGDASSKREVQGSNLEVHKEIIPVVTAALGPAAAAASTIIAVLNGLQAMHKDSPWITLFSRESQRASANQFQVSYTTVKNGQPLITLVGFELEASGSVTQVLFFKFSESQAKLEHFDVKLSVDTLIFDRVKDAIQAKIESHISRYISGIRI